MWMCDLSVLGELLRKKPAASAERWLRAQNRLALSVVTVEEFFCEVATAAQATWFSSFLEQKCEVLNVSLGIAQRSGELRARFQRQGEKRSQSDLLVAATALEHGRPLATKNTSQFERCGVAVMSPFEDLK